ncbi:hypothetical protein MTO96_018536 [Rhipicephalus appendiculatus]
MAESKASSTRPLLLYSSTDTESLFEILNELPIPLKFLRTSVDDVTCELYGYIEGRPRMCGVDYTGDYVLRHDQRLIYAIASVETSVRQPQKHSDNVAQRDHT